MAFKRIHGVLSVVLVAAVGVSAWAYHKHLQKKNTDVVIRIFDSTGGNEFDVAKILTGHDYLKEQGVHVQRIISVDNGGGTVAIQALVANNVDYAGSAYTAWINAIARGAKLTAVVNNAGSSQVNPGNGLVVLENSNIHNVHDLAGKRIAVNVLGALSDYAIRDILRRNGMSFDQVQLVVVPSRNIEKALRTNQVDVAAWTTNGGVDYEITKAHGGVRELPGTRRYDLYGSQVTFGSGFRTDFIKQHPDEVRHFVTAIELSRRAIWEAFQKDPAVVRKAYADATARKGGNPELAKYYKPNFVPAHLYANDRDIQDWIDILAADGKIKPGQVKPEDVYTHKFNPFYNAELAHSDKKL